MNYFAVDLGATSGRTILASFDGKKIDMKEITRFANPMIPLGGHLYWNIAGLYNEVLAVSLRRLLFIIIRELFRKILLRWGREKC